MIRRLAFLIPLVTYCAMAQAATFIIDDFDDNEDARVQSRAFTPDTTVTPFASLFDVFGEIDRTQNIDFADDSVTIFPGDNFGIVPETKTDFFFGVEDIDDSGSPNIPDPINPGGGGTGVWTVDITGLTDLSISILFSAMGDFEAEDNSHTFTASIDGGAEQTLIAIDADTSIDPFTYTMADGVTTNDINDPLRVTDSLGTRIIDNSFTTSATGVITGTGSLLTLTYTAGANNGGSEAFAFDDIILSDEGVAVPDVDLDNDGDVDGADFLDIQRTNPTLIADWQLQFGNGTGGVSAASAVPEPASIALIGLAVALYPLARRRRG